MGSDHLASALPRLEKLLQGLLALSNAHESAGSSPASSSSQRDRSAQATAHQAQLCEVLLRAVLWIGWAKTGAQEEVSAVLMVLLGEIGDMLKGAASPGESTPPDSCTDCQSSP